MRHRRDGERVALRHYLARAAMERKAHRIPGMYFRRSWDGLSTRAALHRFSASRAKTMPEALTSPGHPNEPYYL